MNRTQVNRIWLTDQAIFVELNDGRVALERFSDYRALESTSVKQRGNYTVSYFGVHWPELDEDLSFDGFFNKS